MGRQKKGRVNERNKRESKGRIIRHREGIEII